MLSYVSQTKKGWPQKRHHLFYTCGSILLSQPRSCFFPFSTTVFKALTKFERQRKTEELRPTILQQVTATEKLRVTHYEDKAVQLLGITLLNTGY
ncbi:hypothetical protein CW304_05820 [Bacillus sp. UFRGS-B20]|nr:hypothetical protein CW304_05820 [Bacillus sp. UFRGS-B20]